jgi:hypothetical protein
LLPRNDESEPYLTNPRQRGGGGEAIARKRGQTSPSYGQVDGVLIVR